MLLPSPVPKLQNSLHHDSQSHFQNFASVKEGSCSSCAYNKMHAAGMTGHIAVVCRSCSTQAQLYMLLSMTIVTNKLDPCALCHGVHPYVCLSWTRACTAAHVYCIQLYHNVGWTPCMQCEHSISATVVQVVMPIRQKDG